MIDIYRVIHIYRTRETFLDSGFDGPRAKHLNLIVFHCRTTYSEGETCDSAAAAVIGRALSLKTMLEHVPSMMMHTSGSRGSSGRLRA